MIERILSSGTVKSGVYEIGDVGRALSLSRSFLDDGRRRRRRRFSRELAIGAICRFSKKWDLDNINLPRNLDTNTLIIASDSHAQVTNPTGFRLTDVPIGLLVLKDGVNTCDNCCTLSNW